MWNIKVAINWDSFILNNGHVPYILNKMLLLWSIITVWKSFKFDKGKYFVRQVAALESFCVVDGSSHLNIARMFKILSKLLSFFLRKRFLALLPIIIKQKIRQFNFFIWVISIVSNSRNSSLSSSESISDTIRTETPQTSILCNELFVSKTSFVLFNQIKAERLFSSSLFFFVFYHILLDTTKTTWYWETVVLPKSFINSLGVVVELMNKM